MLIDISDVLQINVFALGAVFLQMCHILHLENQPMFFRYGTCPLVGWCITALMLAAGLGITLVRLLIQQFNKVHLADADMHRMLLH